MVEICETVLFEAQRSGSMDLYGLLAGAELLDNVGYRAIEVMPPVPTINNWEQIKRIKQVTKSTPLLVSVNADLIPEKMLEHFIESGAMNGVEIFRIHEETNNQDNILRAISIIAKIHRMAECTIMCGRDQDTDTLIKSCNTFKEYGCGSFCISDPSGVLGPQKTIELVSLLKKEIAVPIALRFSSTSELAGIAYYAGASAGVDSLYCLLSLPYGRQRLPQTETILSALSGSNWNADLESDVLNKAAQHFKKMSVRGPRAYDVDISGNKYHVVVHPSEIHDEIDRSTRAPSAIPPARPRAVPLRPATKITRRRGETAAAPRATKTSVGTGMQNVTSTMEGIIVKILVKEGDTIKRGSRVLILEAMKMQNEVLSPIDGTVARILVAEGETVRDGQDLVTIITSDRG